MIERRITDSSSHQLTKLSIIVPVYNEPSTLEEIVNRLLALEETYEVILVNDGSANQTTDLITKLSDLEPIQVIHHQNNRGKGAAIRTGLDACRGDIIAIQDADLEYDPAEISKLIAPIIHGDVDVVYGSRFLGPNATSTPFYRRMANQLLTWTSNQMTGLELTDMETCYKVMTKQVIQSLELQENRFGIEPELTAKIAKQKWRLIEIPISYQPRGYSDGKKIGIRDGLRAVWCIWKYHK